MLKTIVAPDQRPESDTSWLDLSQLARVELTSEESGFPIESVFQLNPGPGWRAAQPGEQTIRLLFNTPQTIRRIRLIWIEEQVERQQEFVLRWLPAGARDYRDIVRQQYVFSPGGATREIEEYQVDLRGVVALELRITPDVANRAACASLQTFQAA